MIAHTETEQIDGRMVAHYVTTTATDGSDLDAPFQLDNDKTGIQ